MEPKERKRWTGLSSAFDALSELRATLVTLVILLLVAVSFYALYYIQSLRSASDITSDLMAAAQQVPHKGDEKALRAALNEVLVSETEHHFWQEFALHLAVSLLVAFTVIVSVEIYASQRKKQESREHEKNLAISVWKAIFERFIPEGVVRELEGIVKTEAIKEDCRYVLTFLRPYLNMAEDRIVLRREARFKVRNIKNKTIDYPLRASITDEQEDCLVQDRDGKEVIVPRHLSAVVNNVVLPLESIVTVNERNQKRNLEYIVSIDRDQAPIDVYLASEEMVPLQGLNAYLQLTPIHDLTVEVRNNCEELIEILGVQFNHPNVAGVKKSPEWVYEYKGGILPGQGFQVSWKARTRQKSVQKEEGEVAILPRVKPYVSM